jgi:hypothetical protein
VLRSSQRGAETARVALRLQEASLAVLLSESPCGA